MLKSDMRLWSNGREFRSGRRKAKNAVTARLYKVNGRLVAAVRDAIRGPSIFFRGLFGIVDAIFWIAEVITFPMVPHMPCFQQ